MSTIISAFSKTVEAISKVFFKISVVVIFLLTINVFFNVFMRYAFNEPLEWGEEISSYMFVLLVFFGASEMARTDAHIRVEFIAEALFGKKGILIIQLCALLIGLFWGGLIAAEAWNTVSNAYKYQMVSITQLKFPLFISFSFLSIGLTLLVAQFIVLLGRTIRAIYSK